MGHAVRLMEAEDPASARSGNSEPAMSERPGTSARRHAGHSTSSVAPCMGERNVAQHTSPRRVAQATVVQCRGQLLISVSSPFAGGFSATRASIGAALGAATGPDWLATMLIAKPREPAITLPTATQA